MIRLEGAIRGVRQTIPIAVGDMTVGVVFGIAARRAGLDPASALLMSGFVAAGTSQFVALGLWATPLPIITIVLTTMLVNLRYILMGAALSPWLKRLPSRQAYPAIFLLTDETFALTMRDFSSRPMDLGFLMGSGLLLVVTWVGGTWIGAEVGGLFPDPARWGLDFAAVGVLAAVLAGMWHGKSALLPWLTAAAVAFLAAKFLPGNWYIVLGGIAGSLAGAITESLNDVTAKDSVGVVVDAD